MDRRVAVRSDQMRKQNARADRDQDDAADELRAAADTLAETVTAEQADRGEGQRDDADHDARHQDADLQQRHRETDGQRIDAGRDRQQHQRPFARRVGESDIDVLLVAVGIKQHLAADPNQQGKSDPVVEGTDQMFDLGAEVPSDDRHQSLEETEMKREAEVVAKGKRAQARADRDGDGESIHRQTDSDGENGQKTQAGPATAKRPKS